MKNNFKQTVEAAESILVLLPKSPYFDQVGAALALYQGIKQIKNTSIIGSSPTTVEFNRLVDVNKIKQDAGNKNLVITFKDYQAQNIERVAYDIENGEFKLSVIPKPGLVPPAEDQVSTGYSGVDADLVILVGGGNEGHFPFLSKPELSGAKKAHIGLSQLNPDSKDILNFAQTSSSTTEVAYELLKELGVEITADMASNLLAGIHEGSKNFSSTYVSADTFRVASELMSLGASYTSVEKPQKTYTAKDFGQEAKSTSSPIAAMDDIDNEEEEKPQPKPQPTIPPQASTPASDAPKSWLEPKIYKGTSNN